MTKYPIGIQNFESLRMDGFAYYRVRVQVRVRVRVQVKGFRLPSLHGIPLYKGISRDFCQKK